MIRALLAEDSPTSRVLLTELLESDPAFRVVGVAKDGAEAVSLTKQLRPDVIVMDLHMPEMNGLAATQQIMVETPTPIVIVTASADATEVAVSLNALRAGALTVLPKPAGPGSETFLEGARQFIATIKSMSQVKVVRRWGKQAPSSPPPRVPILTQVPPVAGCILAIATSTGGPAALYRILSELPADFPVSILVVQHIAHGFVEGFGAWLKTGSALKIKVARHHEPLVTGTVYLAPDDHHLGLADRHSIAISRDPPVGGFRPSASFLFDSVARMYGRGTVAVILTGMGQDGVEGLRVVRAAGGRIIAQDEESSVVFGMPGAAIEAGLSDMTLPLGAIGFRIRQLLSEKEKIGGVA